jgi:hypothetical protein
MVKEIRLSNLQEKILIFMLQAARLFPGLFPLRDIKRSFRNHCIYYACYSLESSGLVRMQRKPNRQVFIGLTDAGHTVASSLNPPEHGLKREAENRILPFRPQEGGVQDIEVDIRGRPYTASRAAFVIRSDGTVSLALWSENSGQAWLNGNTHQVSEWYQTCYDAGLPVNVQVDDDRRLVW